MINLSYIFNSDKSIFLKKILTFLIILWIVILILGLLLWNNDKSEIWQEYNVNFNKIDVIFTGSSHSAFGLYPAILDSITGYYSFNLSTPAQSPKTAFIVIDYIIRKSSPKYIILDNYFLTIFVDDQFQNQIIPVSQFESTEDIITSVKNNFNFSEKIYFSLPITWYKKQLGTSFKNLVKIFFKQSISNEGEIPINKGFFHYTNKASYSELKTSNLGLEYLKVDDIDNDQLNYLQKIIDLAKDNEVEIIFCSLPLPQITRNKVKNFKSFQLIYYNIAKKNNINFIDFNNIDLNLVDTIHFKDTDHLNIYGANLCTEYLSKNLGLLEN